VLEGDGRGEEAARPDHGRPGLGQGHRVRTRCPIVRHVARVQRRRAEEDDTRENRPRRPSQQVRVKYDLQQLCVNNA